MGIISNNTDASLSTRSRIFKNIYGGGRVSKQDIANSLEMSLPTVTSNLKQLVDMGLVDEVGEFESKGGRKAKAISFVRNYRYAVGLDITKNHVSIALINLAGEVAASTRLKRPFSRTPEYFKEIGNITTAYIAKHAVPEAHILGVGVSIPGFLDESETRILHSYPLGISDLDCREFIDQIPYPCLFCNDANAACIAEMWNREIAQNVAYLSLSNSVGGSIMINNQLFLGENLRSAEFGHMTLYPGGRPCYCGKKGCMDAYCSALVLTEDSLGVSTLKEFFRKLESGDEFLQDAWDKYLNNLAVAINTLRMAFDSVVIVGGYVGGYLDKYIHVLRQKAGVLNPFGEDAQYLKACVYKNEASAVGAALLNVESFIERL